jgi:anti-sigma factor ChrR (cupin superfamily)
MDDSSDDAIHSQSAEYAMGILAPKEARAFEGHLDRCPVCAEDIRLHRGVLSKLIEPVRTGDILRAKVMDFTWMPQGPVDLRAYQWDEIAPGVRLHLIRNDLQRGVVANLMWASPGAARPDHRHIGDEEILILEGGLSVGEDRFASGEICRVGAGSVHAERALPDGGECICYVLHRTAAKNVAWTGELDPHCRRCSCFALHHAALVTVAV